MDLEPGVLKLVVMSVLVAIAAFAYDFVFTAWQGAINATRDALREGLEGEADACSSAAGRWSVLTYSIGIIGTAGVLKISMWLIIPEMIGLYFGSKVGALRQRV